VHAKAHALFLLADCWFIEIFAAHTREHVRGQEVKICKVLLTKGPQARYVVVAYIRVVSQ
jgi:hypothetical protein